MRKLTVSLPVFGKTDLFFHNESEAILSAIGQKEIKRLNKIPHLGLTSLAFTGVNHSRLEYMLLQCAVISHVAKLHKDIDDVALSGSIKLNGIGKKISSSEELLKIWAILSNYGHLAGTFGLERILFNAAYVDKDIFSWLSRSSTRGDINSWCRSQIRDHSELKTHYMIALRRASYLPKHSRNKALIVNYLRNYLLPISDLFPTDAKARFKLQKARAIYKKIRLLVIVSLDSYYSHHPVRIDLPEAINNISNLVYADMKSGSFEEFLEHTAGCLADELYLHSEALKIYKSYETEKAPMFSSRFHQKKGSQKALYQLLNQLLHQGLGDPDVTKYKTLMRISLPRPDHGLLGASTNHHIISNLSRDITNSPITEVIVDQNYYNSTIHIDLLFDPKLCSAKHIAEVGSNLYKWLRRSIRATSLRQLRETFGRVVQTLPRHTRKRLVYTRSRDILIRDKILLSRLFFGVLKYLLNDGLNFSISSYDSINKYNIPMGIYFTGEGHFKYTDHDTLLKEKISPLHLVKDAGRIHELKTSLGLFNRSKFPLRAVTTESILIRDEYGKAVDEWDSAIIEISDDKMRFRIIEAKKLQSRAQSENQSFNQLSDTINRCLDSSKIKYSRQRIKGAGAVLTVYLDES